MVHTYKYTVQAETTTKYIMTWKEYKIGYDGEYETLTEQKKEFFTEQDLKKAYSELILKGISKDVIVCEKHTIIEDPSKLGMRGTIEDLH